MSYMRHCVRRAITTLFIDNPPIQALSASVIEELHKNLEQIENEDSTEAVILMGANDIFSGGADINEFKASNFVNRPAVDLGDLVNKLDSFKKPITAFIQRYAFGGGLELALGCHYRLAEVGAKVGFPEVKIGLIPGAQGTQRLPRLINPRLGMEMVVWGNPITADTARDYGIIDEMVPMAADGGMDAVYEFVESIMKKPIPTNRRLSKRPVTFSPGDNVEKIITDTRLSMGKLLRGDAAPLYGLRAVKAGLESRSFEIGVLREKQLFAELFNSGQSAALQYAFQASNKAKKLPKDAADAVPLPVRKVCVLGGGIMGQGIVAAFARSGLDVVLLERNAESAQLASIEIRRILDEGRLLGRISEDAHFRATSDPEAALSDVDLVVEAVWENMELKKKVFAMMDKLAPEHALLASNTSTLDIDEIGACTSRPGSVIGAHFFNPVYHMRPLEIVRGKNTSPQALTTLHSMARAIGKVPFTVGNCFGFCGNRMLFPLLFEAAGCLFDGATALQVDEALEEFGLMIGPFRTMDLIGIDVLDLVFREMKNQSAIKCEGYMKDFANFVNIIVHKHNRKGRKTGAGWYKYEIIGGKTASFDPQLAKLFKEFRNKEDLPPRFEIERVVTPQEIIDRCIFGMVNEGFKILDDGVVESVEVIDAMMLQAYGWPQARGGPMYYAGSVGLRTVLEKVNQRYLVTGLDYMKPSSLLVRLAGAKQDVHITKWARMSKL